VTGVRTLLVAASVFFCIAALAPAGVVLISSFGGGEYVRFPPQSYSLEPYRKVFDRDGWRTPLLNSAFVAVSVASIGTVVGLAFAISRRLSSAGVARSAFVAHSLLAGIPPMVVAVGLTLLFGRFGLLDTFPALIAAQMLLGAPFAGIILYLYFRDDDGRAEVVASLMTAPLLLAIARVSLPRFRNQIFAAWVILFVTSLDDAVLSLYVSGRHTETLPRRMWAALRYDIDPSVAAVASIVCVGAILLQRRLLATLRAGAL
jgi:ABC-type spermidine/putrescine transport system permease subunit II